MLNITKVDHIGIRVRDKNASIAFYESLGFEMITDVGFDEGHPVLMQSASGVVLNLLGPSIEEEPRNILMDIPSKHAGYTHMALRVESLDEAEAHFGELGYEITGRFSFKDLRAIFIRDPDLNVIEFDEYPGDEPESRSGEADDAGPGYDNHP